MGLGCKPVGKFRSIMDKLSNEQNKAAQAAKKKTAKEKKQEQEKS